MSDTHHLLRSDKKMRPFTLVLGGGGARGLAHIGVLKALEKLQLIPSLIVGTSMGAVVGAMYAQMLNAELVEERFAKFLRGKFYRQIGLEQFSDTDDISSPSVWERFTAHLRQRYLFSRSALGSGEFARTKLLQALGLLLDDAELRDLRIPFAAVTCDLTDGEEFIFTSGPLVTAVAASAAVVGVVAPIRIGRRLFIDGTVTSTIPVPAARSLSPNPVIAVDVRKSLGEFAQYRRGYEVVLRSNEITSYKFNEMHLRKADVVLRPHVTDFDWNQFRQIKKCVKAGEISVEQNRKQILAKLKKKFWLFPW